VRAVPHKVRDAARRHRGFVMVVAAYVAVFLVYGLAIGASVTIPYAVLIAGGAVFVGWLEPPVGFSRLVLVGLTLWGFGHLAGGIVDIGDDRVLYNALIGGQLHFDNVVHFIGFGSAALLWWEATRPWLPALDGHLLGIWAAVWFAGMGAGALNEVVEFGATLVLPDTNVGGYHNTGRDLVANMLGAAVAGLVAVRRARHARADALAAAST
jgi:hypothetical protein